MFIAIYSAKAGGQCTQRAKHFFAFASKQWGQETATHVFKIVSWGWQAVRLYGSTNEGRPSKTFLLTSDV